MNTEILINFVIQLLGIGAAFYLAYNSFQKRRIQLGTEPTLPEYFTRRTTYWLGTSTYCVLMALFYWLLSWRLLPLEPLVTLIVTNLRSRELLNLLNGLDGKAIIPLIAAGLFLFFIAWESKLNPLLILRDSIHDAFAIPTSAVEVYNALIASRLSAVDDNLKSQISGRLLVPSFDPDDFEKSNTTVEYKWAHICLLFDQIQNYANKDSFRRLFNEPSLKWGEICISYNAMSEKMLIWKDGEPHYTKTVKLIHDLDELNGLLCRLLASLVVFGSASEEEIWATVKQLGGNVYKARVQNTYKYILIFTAAAALGVIFGREISVSLHNAFLFPSKQLAHFNSATLRWVAYGVLMYVIPLTLVLFARNIAYKHRPEQTELSYGFYIGMMMLGFLVSTATSTLILELTFYRRDYFNFLDSFIEHMRWGILPAFMSGFVAYRMDTPVLDSESLVKFILTATLRFLSWGTVAVIFMLYATDDLSANEMDLRFTIVGTAFFVLGLLGASARFTITNPDE